MNVGDMIRFLPGYYSHFARKLILYSDSANGKIRTIPEKFWSGEIPQMYPSEVLQTAWELATDIFKSCLPEEFDYPNYAVSVELLKYPRSLKELRSLCDLVADSDGGVWTDHGRKLDIYRGKVIAGSPFDKKIVGRIFRFGSKIPGINLFLELLNRSVFYRYLSPKDAAAIGPPHTDGIRTLTLLAGERDTIFTEIYDGKRWHEIPLTSKSLYILPSEFLSNKIGIKPTFHRISIRNNIGVNSESSKPNVTLLLGIVDAEKFKPFSKSFNR